MISNQRWHSTLIAAVAAGIMVMVYTTAQATPVLRFWPQYEYSQDETFTTTYYTLLSAPRLTQPADYHVFSLWMDVTGAASSPEESFWAALLDIDLGPGFTAATYEGDGLYSGQFPMVDPPGATPNGPLFSSNTDTGEDPTDLQRIMIITNSNPAYAHAADPGEAAPFKLGQFSVNYDWHSGHQSYVGVKESIVSDSIGMWVGTDSVIVPDDFLLFDQVNLSHVPEPSTIALVGLALVGLAALVRRR